jgi:ATP-dependent Clp protease ATP-binding subunit ClpC
VYPFERFSEDAKMVLTLAQGEAERSHHSYIGTEHLLLALVRLDGIGARTLKALGLTEAELRDRIVAILGRNEAIIIQQMVPTSRVKRVIEIAFEEARRQEMNRVGTDHLLLALVIEGEGVAAQVLADKGVDEDSLRAEIQRQRESGPAEAPSPPSKGQRVHRHFVLTDERGRTIRIDASFSGYSGEECDAVEARLRQTLTS